MPQCYLLPPTRNASEIMSKAVRVRRPKLVRLRQQTGQCPKCRAVRYCWTYQRPRPGLRPSLLSVDYIA